MVARQLLPHRGAGPARPRGPARSLRARAAAAGQRRVHGLPAHLRGRARADRAHRLPPRRGVPLAVHRRLPGGLAADHRRGVGRTDHAAHRPGREPATALACRRSVAARRALRGHLGREARAHRARQPRWTCPRFSASWRSATQGAAPPFFVRLVQRLGELERGGETVNAWLEHRLSADGIVLETAAAAAQQEQAANQVSIANAITSIRLLDALDWREFFESVSVVEAALRKDPARTYAAMDFESRDRYRHAVEEIARRSDYSEIGVAEAILELARRGARRRRVRLPCAATSAGGSSTRAASTLEQTVGYRPRKRERFYRSAIVRRHGRLLLGHARRAERAAARPARLVCVERGGGAVADRAPAGARRSCPRHGARARGRRTGSPSLIFPPKRLAKLDFRRPLDESHRTLVGRSRRCSPRSASTHEVHRAPRDHLPREPRPQPRASRCSATCVRAPSRPAPTTASSSRPRCAASPSSTSATRPSTACGRSTCSSAPGRSTTSEGVWMGWERKRGALARARARDARAPGHVVLDQARRRGVPARRARSSSRSTPTRSCRATARASSSRRSRTRSTARAGDRASRACRRGYGLVQPRVGMTLAGSRRSRFAAMYSGPTGIDPYAGAVSDTYQDVFGEGSFTGKGIFEVDVFDGVARGPLRRELAAQPRPRRGLVPAHRRSRATSRCSTTTPRTTSPQPRACTAGCAATGRRCRGCSAACRTRGRAHGQPALDAAPLEDRRQPAPLARRADACSRCSPLGWLAAAGGRRRRGRCSWRSCCCSRRTSRSPTR